MEEKYIKVSEDTIPEKGKKYSIEFEFEATEAITEEDMIRALDVVNAVLKGTYPISGGHRVMSLLSNETFEAHYCMRIYYTIEAEMEDTFRDFWDKMKSEAGIRYLDLSSPKFSLVRQPSYWWIWLLISGVGIGTIIAIINKKKIKES